jgi:hypothetical protein
MMWIEEPVEAEIPIVQTELRDIGFTSVGMVANWLAR